METEIKMISNNVPRDIIEAYELTSNERTEFDYIDWQAVENGEANPSFIRYKGNTYDLGELQTTSELPEFSPLRKWDGYSSDSFFSGIVVKYCDNFERVIVGRFFS